MVWLLMYFDTSLLEKVFLTICFLQLSDDNNFFYVGPYLFKNIYVTSKSTTQLQITTIIQPTFIYVYIFRHFSNRYVYISHIFIFHAKVIFSGFLFCISQLFTAFWKFLSSIVLFFHEHFYCISALLKKIAVGSLKDNCKFDIIPHNLTNRIKPLDISINLSIKGFI